MDAAPTDDRDSATFSIDSSDGTQTHTVGKLPSADDTILPAFRRTAVQIVSQSLSPRRNHEKATVNNHNAGTMQITKLVLKTPPGSPKRQPKAPGIIIHSLQTLAAPVLCTGHDHDTGTETTTKHSIKNHNVLMENRNIPATHEDTITAPAYRIIPIDPSGGKHRKEERTTTSEAQDLIRDSFKENKTPPPSPAVVVTRLTGSLGSTDSDSRIAVTEQKTRHPLPTTNARSTANECAKKKEKSYDPVRAREFIREQQAKRRLEKKDPPASASGGLPMTEKDLIKQRLENLRKSSHTLVKKNIQKARTQSASCTPKDTRVQATPKPTGKSQPAQTAPRPAVAKPLTIRKFSSTPSLRLVSVGSEPKVDEKSSHKAPTKAPLPVENRTVPASVLKRSSVNSNSVVRDPLRVGKLRPSSAQTSSSSVTLTSRPATVGQKIGILRKPDNVLLEDILPFSPLKNPQTLALLGPTSNAFSTRPTPTTMVNAQLIVINDEDRGGGQPLNEAEKELKLKVPDVTLVPEVTLPPAPSSIEREDDRRKVDPSQEHDLHHSHHSIKSIPPWLKQSLRQPDPYPFILAVRKKLEAVRNVRAEEEAKNRTMKPSTEKQEELNARTNAYLDVIHGVPKIGQKPTKVTPVPMANNEPSLISTNISGNGEFNTSSEISSIKSDVALPLPPLFSSTKIEMVPARIDHHHPTTANAPVSPLSVEQIASLRIISTPVVSDVSRSPPRQEDKHVEERVRPMPPPPQPSGLPETSDRTQREHDYQRMLDAFNRSLTHVIEVNQQLYSALQKPPPPQRPVAMPQEILKIRDEMTQTSAPLPVVSSEIGGTLAVPQARKALSSITAFPSPSATTASHYSDDFEPQSQTGLETPKKKSPTMSSFSSPSSSSPSSSASSSSTSPTASPTGSGDGTSSTASATSSHSVTDRQESDSKPTTANNNTSDFDSRSSGHSDNSHNNTANNNIPPVAEEYLPSFEESLRRGQMSGSRHNQDNRDRDAKHTSRKEDSGSNATGGESSIGEEIHSIAIDGEERSFFLNHSEEAAAQKLKENFIQGAAIVMEKPTPPGFRKASMGDTTLGSDLLATIFNRTDLEVSILSTTVSETNLSYSSIGWYDQLIHSERSREEHLISRVQSKQKALLNRAKGQLAWLELQKQRYRERGQTEHISGIKKKQRAILVRLEKDREELNRTISKSSADSTNNTTLRSGRSPLTVKNMNSKLSSYCSSPPAVDSTSLALRKTSSGLQSHHYHSRPPGSSPQRKRRIAGTTTTSNSIHIAIRGRELEPNERLEDILLRREEELQKRKDHVRRLLEWHRKLEREEADLLAVEEKLRAYNDRKVLGKGAHHKSNPTSSGPSIEARMRSIEKSLETLHSIPSVQVNRNRIPDQPEQGETEEEVVMLEGKKLNQLWRRLTGLKTQRYEIERSYPVTRSMLEVLYEDAKRWVMESLRPGQEQRNVALLDESNATNSSLGTIHAETTAILNTSALGNVSPRTMVPDENRLGRGEPREEVVESKPHFSPPQVDVGDAQSSSEKTETTEHKNIPEESLREDEELPAAEGQKTAELLSSTVKSWSPESRRSTGSVEFHTLEETAYQTADFGSQEESPGDDAAVQSESYSTTFEERSVVEGEHTQPLLEDMSLPPALLNATASFLFSEEDQRQSSDRSSSVMYELQRNLTQEDNLKIDSELELVTQSFRSSLSESMVQSLEEATGSSGECVSTATTPSTVTPTMAIEAINEEILEPETVDGLEEREEDVPEEEQGIQTFRGRSSPVYGSSASELEKRLITLHDELEELSESFERTPLMRSPTTPPPPQPVPAPPLTTSTIVHKLEQHVSSSETPTFEEDRSDDDDDDEHDENETDEDSEATLSETTNHRKGEDGTNNFLVVNNASLITIGPQPAKMEVMVRSKTLIPDPPPVRMPDIINEAEVLRRQELRIEQEIKVLEQQVGFFREIPNKPPPPYIPPANGSPLALLFPPETRIDELIDGRLEELYHQRLPAERLCSDHVTNVYEKLTLDMCNELFRDLRPPEPTVSFRALTHDKRPLAFYNPPDKLGCLRDYLRRKVKRILNEEQQQQHHLVQAQNPLQYHQQQWLHHLQHHQQHHLHHYHQNQVHQQQQQQQQLLHQCATVPLVYANGACAGKRKRDQVDEILAEEMHDDDAHWTNFDREEVEVKDRITDELLKSLFGEALRDMTEAYRRKLQRKEEATSAPKESAM
ncbi:uncharacterized protein LOC131208202 [Anopheles bellator]|uniref:uncharacterized protein LOC131208202 n=1 Tax=Anopheles bellator TaxID=139047 RepID=UPI0026484C92|nr:uncharacterized protein LOC131208202 [Anopheles bellator]